MILSKDTLPGFLKDIHGYSDRNTSYSPFYSNIGLEIHEDGHGIEKIWLHINRCSRTLWDAFADIPLPFDPSASTPWKLVFSQNDAEADLAFYDTDAFLLSFRGLNSVPLLTKPSSKLSESWIEEQGADTLLIRGYSANGDARDPDENCPFVLGIRAPKGSLVTEENGIIAYADETNTLLLAFAFEALEPSSDRIRNRLMTAPETVSIAEERCLSVIRESVCDLQMTCTDEEAELIAKAMNGLIANTVRAPGRLIHHLSSYPSRGYSSHFMWDTCFQNLAYEKMSMKLAKDFLLQFASCQREDGKYEQFLCSTWGRPSYSQPSLAGWAAVRILEQEADKEFAGIMLDSIEKNTVWWLNNRMTKYGLISCPHGLETGQDDSPRFDRGTTLACDMNSYLLNQMRCIVKMAVFLGDRDKAEHWDKLADAFSAKMTELLFCKEDGIFYDVLTETGEFVKIVSPVSFLPFWADVKMDESIRSASIERYLLSPAYLFGDIPFPSVAYNEPTYEPSHWWRGPTWLPNAWLMLETLGKTGYREEQRSAAKRLHDMIIKDKAMHELFDSATGEGLGESEQGWTCAVFIALCDLLGEET